MEDQTTTAGSGTQDGVATPDIKLEGGTMVVRRPAVGTDEEAWQVWDGLKQNQDRRNQINAKIALRYTGQRPRDPKTLRDEGRSWQSNFPTGMLAGIIERIVPNFINAVETQRYLTQAELPEKIDGAEVQNRDKKTEIFRDLFTKKVRSWPEWRGFNSALITELVLIGYDFTGYTDEDTPWPIFFRQDKAWVDEGSGQFSAGLQVWAAQQPVLIHQVIDKIRASNAADAGWRLDNCVEALNKALPLDEEREGSEPRTLVDLIQEISTSSSFRRGAKGILFGHLFIVEPDKQKGKGRVTHYIMDVKTHKVLFSRKRRFDTMRDVVTMFTLESGNNKFYGSKGVGRKLANLSIGVDELVNDACSQMKMAGLMVLQTDSKTAINVGVKVKAPFAVINSEGKIQKEQFPTDIEAFVALYEQLTKIAEVAVGAYIPNVLASDPSAGRRTAREASIDYSRELQASNAYIARFVGQYQGEMMHKIQLRLGKKDSTDSDAIAFREELIEKGLSDKEIDLLVESPAVQSITDISGQEKQAKAVLAESLKGNPMINQKKLLESQIIAAANPETAADWMLTEADDQTMTAEAIRMQSFETKAMEGGEPIPVSPRDPHEIHLKVLIPTQKRALTGLLDMIQHDPGQIAPAVLDGLHLTLIHGEAHIGELLKGGMKKDALDVPIQFYKEMDQIIMKAGQAAQEAAIKAHEEISKQREIASQMPPGAPTGAAPGAQPELPPEDATKIMTSIYKDSPDHIKRQVERKAGLDTTGLPDETNPEPPATTPPITTVAPPDETPDSQASTPTAPEPAAQV